MPDEPDKTDHAAANADNPFAVSSLFQGPLSEEHAQAPPTSWFRVEGDVLLCGHGAVLPAICVDTLLDENLKPMTVRVGFPFSKFIVVSRFCTITYFESGPTRKIRLIKSCFGLMMFSASLMLLMLALPSFHGLPLRPSAIGSLLCFLIGIATHQLSRRQLLLVGHDPPGVFYVRGFPKHFLSHLATT